jgi:hypothetical protein
MTGEEELGMDLFSSEGELELNLDISSSEDEDIKEEIETTGEGGDESQDSEIVASEDESEDTEPDVESDNESDASPNLYSSFATLLHEEGVLSSLDSDIKIENAADVNALIASEIEKRVSSQYSEADLEDLRALRSGVSKEELINYRSDQYKLDAITPEMLEVQPELRKQIIYQDYINQGLSESKALKLLNRSVEVEQDLEDAIEALPSIKEFKTRQLEKQQEQYRIEEAQREEQYKTQQKKLKDSIYNTDEIIKGHKITKTLQDRVYKSMTNIVGKSPEGLPENQLMRVRREDPIAFDSKLYYLYEITKGFTDFNVLTKQATSKATKNLESALRNNTFLQDSGTPAYLEDDQSYDGFKGEFIL